MLILSRKNREAVVIGGTVGFERLLKITVLGIRGSRVQLGFETDGDIPIHRSEVFERINADSQPAEMSLECSAENLPTGIALD